MGLVQLKKTSKTETEVLIYDIEFIIFFKK